MIVARKLPSVIGIKKTFFLKIVLKLINLEERIAFFFFFGGGGRSVFNLFFPKEFVLCDKR